MLLLLVSLLVEAQALPAAAAMQMPMALLIIIAVVVVVVLIAVPFCWEKMRKPLLLGTVQTLLLGIVQKGIVQKGIALPLKKACWRRSPLHTEGLRG